MIANLKPYPAYKDSGLPWLGQVPGHWELAPNRSLMRIRKKLVGELHNTFTLLSLTKLGVIVRDISEMRGKFSSDPGTSQEVHKGDLVMCLFDVPETPRTVGLSCHSGMITGAYTVMECRRPENAKFLELFYIAMDDRKLLSPLYSGLRNTIPKERLLGTKTPLPPPSEQAAIVRFLDWANGRLERTIRAKQKMVKLLNEQKQAIIHRAVTRGLDPSVPLKDSGIPWLGEIPEHWELTKLRRICFYQEGPGLRTWQFRDSGIQVICVTNIMASGVNLGAYGRFISREEYATKYRHFTVEKGDLMLASSGNSWGKVAKFDGDDTVILNTSTIRLNPNRFAKISTAFLTLVLSAEYLRNQLLGLLTGSCQPNFGPSHLNRLLIAFPTDHAEQTSIVQYVASEVAPLNTTISRLEREITLLREYRTRLVADVVTGKLDVRAAAADLPEQAEPLLTNDAPPDEAEDGETMENEE